MTLEELIRTHSLRNACRCGTCAAPGEDVALEGETADAVFFDVALTGEISAEEFRAALKAHPGAYTECDPLDGDEHNYKELGAWVGDEELAIRMMGMGSLLGVWSLLTPFTEFSPRMDRDVAVSMAQMGMLAVQVRPLQPEQDAAAGQEPS